MFFVLLNFVLFCVVSLFIKQKQQQTQNKCLLFVVFCFHALFDRQIDGWMYR